MIDWYSKEINVLFQNDGGPFVGFTRYYINSERWSVHTNTEIVINFIMVLELTMASVSVKIKFVLDITSKLGIQ